MLILEHSSNSLVTAEGHEPTGATHIGWGKRSRRGWVVAVMLWVAAPSPALADDAPSHHVTESSTSGTVVDWTRGLLLARGASAAGVHAPSAVIARVGAKREAAARAIADLRRAAKRLRFAKGRTVTWAKRGQADKVFSQALEISVTYSSDGSVVTQQAVGLEAIRQLVVGRQARFAPTGHMPVGAPSAIIVDARGHLAKPMLGLVVGVAGLRYAGPTIFYHDIKRAQEDPRLGDRPVTVVAQALRGGGELRLAKAAKATLGQAAGAGALVVVVLRKGKR